jgi:hypothetical protein
LYKIGFSDFVDIPNQAITGIKLGGNFDYYSNKTVWSDNAPSHAPAYPAIYLTRQVLPSSLYLSSQPDWWITPWGTPRWPAIGPDVTGGTDPTGHVFANPAEVCYNSCPKDSAYPEDISGNRILFFNASKHYPSATSAP